MTNEELLSAIRGVVREEVNAGEQRMRILVREEVNAGEQRMRILVREEVNAAVYASEQRMGEQIKASEQRTGERLDKMDGRLDKMDERLDKMDGRLNHLEGMVLPMAEHLRLFKIDLTEMRMSMNEMRADIEKVTGVLDLVTLKINDFEQNMYNWENKIDGYLKVLHKDMEKVYEMLALFTREFNKILREISARLEEHENTPLDETHPRRSPFSAA